jgi:hypothetical protein
LDWPTSPVVGDLQLSQKILGGTEPADKEDRL